MTLSRVSPVQAFVARLRLAVLLSALASLTLLAMPTFASAAAVVPNANPNLTSRCGLNVMVVLDESGSIWADGGSSASGATAAVRNGAMTFVKSLKDTGSKVAMIEFNTNARKAIYRKVEQRVMDTSPWVFINFREQAQAYTKKVRGYVHLGGALNESSAGISLPTMWLQ